jgi:hypothetical protein
VDSLRIEEFFIALPEGVTFFDDFSIFSTGVSYI